MAWWRFQGPVRLFYRACSSVVLHPTGYESVPIREPSSHKMLVHLENSDSWALKAAWPGRSLQIFIFSFHSVQDSTRSCAMASTLNCLSKKEGIIMTSKTFEVTLKRYTVFMEVLPPTSQIKRNFWGSPQKSRFHDWDVSDLLLLPMTLHKKQVSWRLLQFGFRE